MRTTLKFSILIACWAAAFVPIYPELWDAWLHNSNNSHGLIVPFISLLMIYRQQDKLTDIPLESNKIGGIILIASMVIYIVSYIGALTVVSRLMIVSSLIGLVLYAFGGKIFALLRFPLLLLLFMVPVPDSIYRLIAFPLQLFATKVSAILIQAIGIPAFREGNIIYFQHMQLEVAEACSGLRSLMAFFVLGVILAHMMTKASRLKGALLVLSTVPLALCVNIIRITGTGLLAHGYGEKMAEGFLHEFSGIFVFVLGVLLLGCEFMLLSKKKEERN